MTPQEAYIARTIRYFDDLDVLEWARTTAYLDEFASDWDVNKLLTTNNKRADQVDAVFLTFKAVFERHWPSFELSSSASERIARSLFEARLRDYVEGKCRPYDVCRMVGEIEGLFDLPEWLGDMYNACDWVEPFHEPADCRGVLEEAQKLLALAHADPGTSR